MLIYGYIINVGSLCTLNMSLKHISINICFCFVYHYAVQWVNASFIVYDTRPHKCIYKKIQNVTKFIMFIAKQFVSGLVLTICNKGFFWHLSQYSIRSSLYFSSIVKSHSNPFLEPASTKQWWYNGCLWWDSNPPQTH